MKCPTLGTSYSVLRPLFRVPELRVVLRCALGLQSCSTACLFHYDECTHTEQESGPEEDSLKQMLSPDAESEALKNKALHYEQSPCEVKEVLPWPQRQCTACEARDASEL